MWWFYRGQRSKWIMHGDERSKVHTKMFFHHPLYMLIPVRFSEELWTLSWIPLYPHQNNTHVVILIGWSSGQIDGSSIAKHLLPGHIKGVGGRVDQFSHPPNMRPETTCNRCLNVRRHQFFESAVGYKIPAKIIDHGCCNKCYEISTSWNRLGHLLDCVSGRLHYAVYKPPHYIRLGVTLLHCIQTRFKHMTRNRTKPDRKYTFWIELYRCFTQLPDARTKVRTMWQVNDRKYTFWIDALHNCRMQEPRFKQCDK